MSYLQTKGRIFDVQRYSIHDGPGIRQLPVHGSTMHDDGENAMEKQWTEQDLHSFVQTAQAVFDMEKEIRGFSNMRNYWYPLPQHDVDALHNLQQNPGW